MKKIITILLISLTAVLLFVSCSGGEKDDGQKTNHTHSFSFFEEKKPSCTEQGYVRNKCTCGIVETAGVPPKGHAYEYGLCVECKAFAPSTEGLEFAINDEETGYIVLSCSNKEAKDIVIPSSYNSKPVVGIGIQAFSDMELTSITLPETLEYIEMGSALEGGTFNVSRLVRINVHPENKKFKVIDNCLVHIESKTLVLGTITSCVPADGSVTTIGSHAFESCSAITDLVIPEGVKIIEPCAFGYCEGIKNISFPARLESLQAFAFQGCSNIEEIEYAGKLDNFKKLAITDHEFDIDPDLAIDPEYPIIPVKEITVKCSDNTFHMVP